MRRAYCLIRDQPPYRREAFVSGLRAVGYDVHCERPARASPGDCLVIWNRYQETHELATRFEAAGGIVVVAENGYIKGRHEGGDYYALALHAHNGRGVTPTGGPERWEALGVDLKPWRTTGDHILVAANRSFGQPGNVMPANWPDDVAARLRKVTKRPVRIRLHPGNNAPLVPPERDLANAWAVVIWSSSVGVRALIEGIPVICEAPWWVCKSAAEVSGVHAAIDDEAWASKNDVIRLMAMEDVARAQWSVVEIAAGEPFNHLLQTEAQAA